MASKILKSSGYPGALLVRLKELYDHGQLCDFSLVVNNVELRVHSVVLFSASLYFKNMMEEGIMQEPRYLLQTGNRECLEILVHFMYTGCLMLSHDNIWIILALASQLEIPEVTELCQKYLKELSSTGDKLQTEEEPQAEFMGHGQGQTGAKVGTSKEMNIHDIKQELDEPDPTNSRHDEYADEIADRTEISSDDAEDETYIPDFSDLVKLSSSGPNPETVNDESVIEDSEQVKVAPRKRGRPKGSKNKARDSTEANKSHSKVRRKRGRPRKRGLTKSGHDSEHLNKSKLIVKISRAIQKSTLSPFRHVTSINCMEKTHSCGLCSRTFSWLSMLHSHRRVHYSQHHSRLHAKYLLKKARLCKSVSAESSTRWRRRFKIQDLKQQQAQNLINPKYKCEKCSQVPYFTDAKYLYLHDYRHHRKRLVDVSNIKTKCWKCSKCSRQFLHMGNLQKHNKAAHREAPPSPRVRPQARKARCPRIPRIRRWQCEERECYFLAQGRAELTEHLARFHPLVDYSCPDCRFKTRIKALLGRHKESNHGPNSGSHNSICDVCGKIFMKSFRLKQHMFSKHKILDPTLMLHSCSVEDCRYACGSKDGLSRHMAKHQSEKPFICEICGKHFKTQKSVERHTSKVHLGIRDYICDICGKTYGEESGLKIHMVRHSEVKSFHCEYCDYSAFDKGNYKTHLYGIHGIKFEDNMKIYECSMCRFTTSSKYRFSDHMRVHYKVRDIPCPHCDKCFMTRKAMSGHVKKVHNPKDFRCITCAYVTSDKTKLRDHVRIMHTHRNFKPYKCPYCSFQCATGGNCRKHVKHKHKGCEVTYQKLKPEEAVVGAPAVRSNAVDYEQAFNIIQEEANRMMPQTQAAATIMGPEDGNLAVMQAMNIQMSDYDNSTVAWQSLGAMLQNGQNMAM